MGTSIIPRAVSFTFFWPNARVNGEGVGKEPSDQTAEHLGVGKEPSHQAAEHLGVGKEPSHQTAKHLEPISVRTGAVSETRS